MEQLPKRVKYWLSEAEQDCFFIVGPEGGQCERIGALKILLMGDSVPFRAMLRDSDLAEKGDIRITDVEPETFHTYLKCCYGGSDFVIQKLNFEELLKLLYMTDKYLAYEITDKIIIQLKVLFSHSLSNLFIALSNPICYQNGYLTKEILKILKFDFKKIAMEERYLELNHTALAFILEQDSFTLKEIDIWNETVRWAKHKTGSTDGKILRSYIFDLLKHFRFLTMEYTEFWENVVSCEILLEEEVKDICKSFGTGDLCSTEHLSKNICSRYSIAEVSQDITSDFMVNPVNAFICCSVNEIRSSLGPWPSSKCSTTYRWAEHLWIMKVKKVKSNYTKMPCKKKYALSVYIGCQGQSSNWNCCVDVEISLINRSGKPDVSSKFTKTFSEIGQSRWGFEQLQDWNVLIDPDSGFVQENTIILMAKIQLRN